jgi:hypothetical protein
MKKGLFTLVLFAVIGWLYFTPYMALNELQAAAEAGDADALNEMVDFPALRTSIKTEVQGAISRGIQKDGGVFAAAAAAVTGVIVEPVVNAAVTPQGISLMMKGERPTDDEAADRKDDDSWRESTKIGRRYEASDRFVVEYRDRRSGDERISLVMQRDGLRWRLSGIRFPREE